MRAAELAELVSKFMSAFTWLAALSTEDEPCEVDAAMAERLVKTAEVFEALALAVPDGKFVVKAVAGPHVRPVPVDALTALAARVRAAAHEASVPLEVVAAARQIWADVADGLPLPPSSA